MRSHPMPESSTGAGVHTPPVPPIRLPPGRQRIKKYQMLLPALLLSALLLPTPGRAAQLEPHAKEVVQQLTAIKQTILASCRRREIRCS